MNDHRKKSLLLLLMGLFAFAFVSTIFLAATGIISEATFDKIATVFAYISLSVICVPTLICVWFGIHGLIKGSD